MITGCSWWCKKFCPECSPTVVTKPIYIKPPKYIIPLRPDIRLLDEELQLWHPENIRKLAYNISDDQTYIKNLLEVIYFYESYTEKSEELDTENTDQDNIEQDDSENDESSTD